MPPVKLCPVPGCREEIQPKYLTCRHHWFSISRELRDRVWQTAKSPGSPAHRRACHVAIHAATDAERRDRESMRSESVEELAAFVDVVRQMRAAQRAWSQAKRTEDLFGSIKAEGVLEPITVRKLPEGSRFVAGGEATAGDLQLVFGGRRLAAVRKLPKGKRLIPAIVRDDLDDARTLELMAIENGQREDLNPIQKARHIELLCRSPDEGGAGLTREQAAKLMGLKTGQAASNLVRLLELPEGWLRKVERGELPESYARTLLPYKDAPGFLEKVLRQYERDTGPKGNEFIREDWESRNGFEGSVEMVARDELRSLDPRVQYWSRGFYKSYPPLLTEEQRQREDLGVVCLQLPTDEGPTFYATNAKLFDELQEAAVERKQKTGKSSNGKAIKKLTAAGQAAQRKRQAEQLKRRLDDWRHHWIRHLLAARIIQGADGGDPRVHRFLIDRIGNGSASSLNDALQRATKRYRFRDITDPGELTSDIIAEYMEPGCTGGRAHAYVGSPPWIASSDLDHLANAYDLDLAAEWQACQTSHDSGERDRLLNYFVLHPTAQLEKLAGKMKLTLPPGTKKAKLEAIRKALDNAALKIPPTIAAIRKPKK